MLSLVRVLIVDDNVGFLAIAGQLMEQEGLSVVGVATTGAQALRLAEKHGPDVIIVDIELGDESGFDVVERLSALPMLRSSMVLVSAHQRDDLSDLLETSSAVGFLAKSELTARNLVVLLNNAQ